MSLTDRIKSKVERSKPRITECIIYARPLPLIADEKPPAGDDFRFKCVFDPTDRHLRQLETPERLELMKPFFAHGGCVILGIHEPTDTASILDDPHTARVARLAMQRQREGANA